jgi:hypothetical protein
VQKRGRGKNGKNEQRERKSTTEKGRVKVCDEVREKGKRTSEEEEEYKTDKKRKI